MREYFIVIVDLCPPWIIYIGKYWLIKIDMKGVAYFLNYLYTTARGVSDICFIRPISQ